MPCTLPCIIATSHCNIVTTLTHKSHDQVTHFSIPYQSDLDHLMNIRQIPEIEVVVKLDGSWQKRGGDFLVKFQRSFDDVESVSLDHRMEIAYLQMRSEDARINRLQRIEIGERNREHGKVTLQSGKRDKGKGQRTIRCGKRYLSKKNPKNGKVINSNML